MEIKFMYDIFNIIFNKQEKNIRHDINSIIEEYQLSHTLQNLEYEGLSLLFDSFNFEARTIINKETVKQLSKIYNNLNVIFTFGFLGNQSKNLKINLIGQHILDKNSTIQFSVEKIINGQFQTINSFYYYSLKNNFKIEFDNSFSIYNISDSISSINRDSIFFIHSEINKISLHDFKNNLIKRNVILEDFLYNDLYNFFNFIFK